MTQNVNPTFVKTPNWGAAQISTSTTTGTALTVYTGGPNGSKISALIGLSFSTTAAFDVSWGISSGGTVYYHGTASVIAGAGYGSGTPAVNMFSTGVTPLAIDSDGNPFVFLPSSAYTLQTKTSATSTAWQANAFIQVVAPSVADF
jgi:hypothetical protein